MLNCAQMDHMNTKEAYTVGTAGLEYNLQQRQINVFNDV